MEYIKIRNRLILLALIMQSGLLGGPRLMAQDFTRILESIEKNSTALNAQKAKAEAEKKQTEVMTVLDDPEVGVNYLFGSGGIGNRIDITASQSFDFPTTIIQRNKFARELRRASDLRYLSARQKVMLQARKLCIEVVYCNVMMEHLTEDMEETHAMSEAYQKLYERGEATLIDRNKAHQAVLFFEAEHREFMTMRNNLLAQLRYMNNGEDVVIEDTAYVHTPLTNDFEQWLAQNVGRHPDLQLAEGEVSVQKRELSLAKSQWAPKLRVGYMSEMAREDKYHGVSVGLSVPLWSGNRRVKAAEKSLEAAEVEQRDAQMQLTTQLRSVYNEALQLQETYSQYMKHLKGCDNSELLEKSLQKGQITLLTYLQERQYVHEMHERLITAERDLELRKAELDF